LNREHTVSIIQKMPLNTSETKALLLNVFRLTLAVSEKRESDAINTFSNILDGIIVQNIDNAVLDISSIANEENNHVDEINLVIQEDTDGDNKPLTTETSFHPLISKKGEKNGMEEELVVEDEQHNLVEEEEEEEEDLEEEEEDLEEVIEEEEEELEEVIEEEEEEEEEVELNLEPVRIKKTLYWKDLDNGDLYTYLPDDEVGDLIGAYKDGKIIFK